MDAVVKVDKIRQVVDPRPLKRFSGKETGADRLQKLSISPDLRMAAHARLSRREASEGRSLDRTVTIAAVNAVVADMVFVTERNRLVACHIYIGDERPGVDFISRPNGPSQQQRYGYNADFRHAVRAAVKDLCHAPGRARVRRTRQ
jgi:hypothetical protein